MPFLEDLLAGLTGVALWSEERASRYLTFLRRASVVFLGAAAVLLFTLVLGVLLHQSWLISTAGLFIGGAAVILLVLATPLGVPTIWTIETFKTVKAYVSVVAAILLWLLLFSLYVSIVPISHNPKAIALVFLLACVVGLLWARFGLGPDPRRTYASVVMVFLLTTVSLFFPRTFAAAGGFGERLDERMADCLTNPSRCFAKQPKPHRPNAIDINRIPTLEFFDPSSGAPQYWYARSRTGDYELFDAPGFDPQTRDSLRVVTPDIATEIRNWFSIRALDASPGQVSDAGAWIPDVARATSVHAALSVADLDISRAVVTTGGIRGYFDVRTQPSQRVWYTPVVTQLSSVVVPNLFLTAGVSSDSNVMTMELQGLDVSFMVDPAGHEYGIYNAENNQLPFRPFPPNMDLSRYTLALRQFGRHVWVFLNSQPLDSLVLLRTPKPGKVGLFFKASTSAEGLAHFNGLVVYEF